MCWSKTNISSYDRHEGFVLVMAVSLDRTVGSATAEAHPGALAPVSNRFEQARPRDALELWRPEESTSFQHHYVSLSCAAQVHPQTCPELGNWHR